jgi:hypothetical protein
MEPFNWETKAITFIADGRQLLKNIGSDNMGNALKEINGIIAERDRWKSHCEEFCELTNTTHVGNAKQRIRKLMSGATPDELTKLPEAFHKPPAIWLTGKKKTLVTEGFAPMGVRDAERKHRVILPLLVEAWELSEGEDNERLEIEKAYRNWSAEEFEKELYLTINKLEEPTLEELFEERMANKVAEFEVWKEDNAKASQKTRKKRAN